jgi:hypothetical protein
MSRYRRRRSYTHRQNIEIPLNTTAHVHCSQIPHFLSQRMAQPIKNRNRNRRPYITKAYNEDMLPTIHQLLTSTSSVVVRLVIVVIE